MNLEIAATITGARAQLADYRRRATLSLIDSHHTVSKTETLIAETRELIVRLDRLQR